LKLLNISDIKKIDEFALNKHDKDQSLKEITSNSKSEEQKEKKEEQGVFNKLGKLIKKAIDCCIE
ncbi:MAG: hypothetical protein ACPL3E_01415, partial [Minisyncoccia bacterium]